MKIKEKTRKLATDRGWDKSPVSNIKKEQKEFSANQRMLFCLFFDLIDLLRNNLWNTCLQLSLCPTPVFEKHCIYFYRG